MVCVKYDGNSSECYYNGIFALEENVNKRFGKEKKVRKGKESKERYGKGC